MGHNTPLGYHSDYGSMGLGQYNSLGEYCGPHSASIVFLILRLDYCGFGPFCSTGTKLLLSISLLMVLICIIYQ